MAGTGEQERERVAGPASRVSLATAASRVTGLLRESVFAALIGAGGLASAFVMAFRIPNLLRDFFAEGAMSSAFVPAYARVREQQGEPAALRLARRVLGTVLVVTLTLAGLGMLFAPAVVAIIAPDARPAVQDATIRLTRIMFPFLTLAAVAAVLMGVLNAHRRYFVPAIAPAFFNVVAVLGGLGMYALGWGAERAVLGWAVLVLVGGLAQILVQVPAARRLGLRGPPLPDLRLRDPEVRHVATRMAPVVLSLAGTNVMLVIVTALASRGLEWPAWLNYAFRLIHLPIGIVGVALGTVVLAAGARRQAAGDSAALDDLVRTGLRLNLLLSLPAAVGLWVLAEPLVRMVYERGAFAASDTLGVAEAIRAYAPGVLFYAGVKAAAPTFLARGDTRTPMLCSLAGILMTVLVAFAAVGPWGHQGLAFAVSAGAATNFLCLRLAGRRVFGPRSAVPTGHVVRVVLASAVMGGLGVAVRHLWLDRDLAVVGGWAAALRTVGATIALAALYFLVAAALGVDELRGIRRRLWGGRAD